MVPQDKPSTVEQRLTEEEKKKALKKKEQNKKRRRSDSDTDIDGPQEDVAGPSRAAGA